MEAPHPAAALYGRYTLQGHGARVHATASPQAVLLTWEMLRPDVVLADLDGGGSTPDSVAFIRAARELSPSVTSAHPPWPWATALPAKPRHSAGYTLHLSKPRSPASLCRRGAPN